jgi:aconitate hydratase
MEPRFRGCKVVLVKSFARIHEANLKKQGVLPLTFNDKSDYEKINQKDKITIENLENIKPGEPINILITKEDGSTFDIVALHSLSDEQIKWFFSGSALNYIKAN